MTVVLPELRLLQLWEKILKLNLFSVQGQNSNVFLLVCELPCCLSSIKGIEVFAIVLDDLFINASLTAFGQKCFLSYQTFHFRDLMCARNLDMC